MVLFTLEIVDSKNKATALTEGSFLRSNFANRFTGCSDAAFARIARFFEFAIVKLKLNR